MIEVVNAVIFVTIPNVIPDPWLDPGFGKNSSSGVLEPIHMSSLYTMSSQLSIHWVQVGSSSTIEEYLSQGNQAPLPLELVVKHLPGHHWI